MIKKLIVCLFSLCLCFLFTIPAFAQLDAARIKYWEDGVPYDADGPVFILSDETVWCIDETQEDENKQFILLDYEYNILEETSIPYEDDPTDTSTTGYTASSGDATETGWLTTAADVPDEVDGADVLITLTSDEETVTIRLYEANDYESTDKIPVGTYTVSNAKIDGDNMQTYTASYNDSVTVTSTSASNMTFYFSSDVGLINDYDASADASGDVEENEGYGLMHYLFYLFIVVGVGLFAYLIYTVVIKANKE